MGRKINCDICSRPIASLGQAWEVRSGPSEAAPAGMCLIRACADCGPGIGAHPNRHWDENAELVELGLAGLLPLDDPEPYVDTESDVAGLPA